MRCELQHQQHECKPFIDLKPHASCMSLSLSCSTAEASGQLHVQYSAKMRPERAEWPLHPLHTSLIYSTARFLSVCGAGSAQSGSQQHCCCSLQKLLIQTAGHKPPDHVLQTSCAAFSSASGHLRCSTGDLTLSSASPRSPDQQPKAKQ